LILVGATLRGITQGTEREDPLPKGEPKGKQRRGEDVRNVRDWRVGEAASVNSMSGKNDVERTERAGKDRGGRTVGGGGGWGGGRVSRTEEGSVNGRSAKNGPSPDHSTLAR